MMKRYIIFLLGLLILGACANDEYLTQRTEVKEGIPTVVKLSVGAGISDQIETKSFWIVMFLIYMCFLLKRVLMSF